MTHLHERDNYAPAIQASHAQVPNELLLYGFTVYNNTASAQFVQLFDSGTKVPADGTVPAQTWPVAAHSTLEVLYGLAGRLCKQGLMLANSSTGPTKTIGGADCLFDIQYAHISQEG